MVKFINQRRPNASTTPASSSQLAKRKNQGRAEAKPKPSPTSRYPAQHLQTTGDNFSMCVCVCMCGICGVTTVMETVHRTTPDHHTPPRWAGQGIWKAPTQIKRNEVSLNLLTLLNDDDDDDDAGGVVGDDGHLAGICWQPVKANTLTQAHTHTRTHNCIRHCNCLAISNKMNINTRILLQWKAYRSFDSDTQILGLHIDADISVNIIYCAWTHRHVKRTELPSGTITSDEVSSLMKSGGMTTSRKPICQRKRVKREGICNIIINIWICIMKYKYTYYTW